MASIHKDIFLDAHPNYVWDAVRDFGALHTRLVPGFVLDTKLDGDARIVTFANGTSARELLVDSDDKRKRLKLGEYPYLRLGEAREKAEQVLFRVKVNKEDPALETQEARSAPT
jgi:hypothetical protein